MNIDLTFSDLLWDAQNVLNMLDVLAWEMELESKHTNISVDVFLNSLEQLAMQIEHILHRPSFIRNKSSQKPIRDMALATVKTFHRLAEVRTQLFEYKNAANQGKTKQLHIAKVLSETSTDLIDIRSTLLGSVLAVKENTKTATLVTNVFVCHSSRDKKFARKLVSDLKSLGMDVWFDEWAMLPGDSLHERIALGIKNSAWFLIILSKNSVKSKWCRRELDDALMEELERDQVYVIPVLYSDCEIPAFLRTRVWVDARRNKYQNALRKLSKRFGT